MILFQMVVEVAIRPVQPSSQHPLRWWGVNSTLFEKHHLDQHLGLHGA
jgi:hypothetical protein